MLSPAHSWKERGPPEGGEGEGRPKPSTGTVNLPCHRIGHTTSLAYQSAYSRLVNVHISVRGESREE